jgi:hypothetical protein
MHISVNVVLQPKRHINIFPIGNIFFKIREFSIPMADDGDNNSVNLPPLPHGREAFCADERTNNAIRFDGT